MHWTTQPTAPRLRTACRHRPGRRCMNATRACKYYNYLYESSPLSSIASKDKKREVSQSACHQKRKLLYAGSVRAKQLNKQKECLAYAKLQQQTKTIPIYNILFYYQPLSHPPRQNNELLSSPSINNRELRLTPLLHREGEAATQPSRCCHFS